MRSRQTTLWLHMMALTLGLTGCGSGGGSVRPSEGPIVTSSSDTSLSSREGQIQRDYNASANTSLEVVKPLIWYDNGYKGKDVKIGILDSGVNPKENYDFAVSGTYDLNYSFNDGEGFKAEETGVYSEEQDHGAYVASAIGSDFFGMAPDAKLYHAAITDNGSARTSEIIYAASKLQDKTNARIFNASFSLGNHYIPDKAVYEADNYSKSYQQVYAAAEQLNKTNSVLVLSAGNTGGTVQATPLRDELYGYVDLFSDEYIDNVLIAGSIELDGSVSHYTAKPGQYKEFQSRYLMTPSHMLAQDVNGDYAVIQGTSYSTGYVSGALALLKDRWQETPSNDLAQILLDTANRDFANYDPKVHGMGVMDLYRAWQPVGQTSLMLVAEKLPAGAAQLSLPAGFKPLTLNTTVYDAYDRDFATRITSVSQPTSIAQQQLGYRVHSPASPTNMIYQIEQVSLSFRSGDKVRYADVFETVSMPIIGYANYRADVFSNRNATMESLYIKKGDYSLGLAVNMIDRLQATDPNDDSSGYIARVGIKSMQLDYYQGQQTRGFQDPAFYGVADRQVKGIKLGYALTESSLIGIEAYQQQTEGSAVFNQMNLSGLAFFGKTQTEFNDMQFAALAQVEQRQLQLSGAVNETLEDGTSQLQRFAYQDQTFVPALGVFGQLTEHFSASLYKDRFDQNAAFIYRSDF